MYTLPLVPNPNADLVDTIDELVTEFIWSTVYGNSKIQKLNRKTATQPYENGGLQVMDVKLKIQSLKVAWVHRLIKNNDRYWALADLRGGGRAQHMPPYGTQFFHFHTHFWQKAPMLEVHTPLTGQRLPPPWEILDPPLLGKRSLIKV